MKCANYGKHVSPTAIIEPVTVMHYERDGRGCIEAHVHFGRWGRGLIAPCVWRRHALIEPTNKHRGSATSCTLYQGHERYWHIAADQPFIDSKGGST